MLWKATRQTRGVSSPSNLKMASPPGRISGSCSLRGLVLSAWRPSSELHFPRGAAGERGKWARRDGVHLGEALLQLGYGGALRVPSNCAGSRSHQQILRQLGIGCRMLHGRDGSQQHLPRQHPVHSRRWNEDGSSSCVKCENNKTLPAAPVYNLTDCQNDAAREFSPVSNITTVTPETLGVGGPEVAASLILGTFVISLFLILCVASFFYLKRANKLPSLFYRRSKGSIVQSAESASMLSPPSSIRKPRYVRRDRSLASSTTSTTLSAETRVSNV